MAFIDSKAPKQLEIVERLGYVDFYFLFQKLALEVKHKHMNI